MKNKIFTLILSFVISFGLWLYVVTVISPESEATFYNVSVELKGMEYLNSKDLIITSDTKNLKLDELKLGGNRSDLNKLSSSNITVTADLSTITEPGEYQLPWTVSFQSATAEVLEQENQYITVIVAEQATKTVEIKPLYSGKVSDGYEADKENIRMDHTTVTVKGPKDTIDKIEYARITIDISNRNVGFKSDYDLVLCDGSSRPVVNDQYVTMNLETVTAALEIYKVKKIELNYVLDMTDSGLREEDVTLTPVGKVTLIGSDDALNSLDEQFKNDQYTFTIKVSEYKQTTTTTLVLPLPSGVSCKEKIEIQIAIPDMTQKTFKLDGSAFVLQNVPEGLQVNISGNQTIAIWGPESVLEELDESSLRIFVDCTDLTADSTMSDVVYTVKGYEYLRVDMRSANAQIISTDEITEA